MKHLFLFCILFSISTSKAQVIELTIYNTSNVNYTEGCIELTNPQDFLSWKWLKSYDFDGHDYYELYPSIQNEALNCDGMYWNYAIEAITTSNDTLFQECQIGYDSCVGLYADIYLELISGSTYVAHAYTMGGTEGVTHYTYWDLNNIPGFDMPSMEDTIVNAQINDQINVWLYDTATYCLYVGSNVIKDCSNAVPENYTLSMSIPSTSSSCDGVISLHNYVTPFQRFYVSDTVGYVLPNEANEFCSGIYDLTVFETSPAYFGCKTILPVFVPDPANVISNPFTLDSLLVDTLFHFLEENCDINYQTIDSAYIDSYSLYGVNSLEVIWNVIDSNGMHQITMYYPVPVDNGFYLLNLQLYCPQKSSDNYLFAFDEIALGTSLSSNSIDINSIHVYPNPSEAGGEFMIDTPTNGILKLIDLHGRIVQSTQLEIGLNKISTQYLTKGTYFVKIENENHYFEVKQIILK